MFYLSKAGWLVALLLRIHFQIFLRNLKSVCKVWLEDGCCNVYTMHYFTSTTWWSRYFSSPRLLSYFTWASNSPVIIWQLSDLAVSHEVFRTGQPAIPATIWSFVTSKNILYELYSKRHFFLLCLFQTAKNVLLKWSECKV